MTLSADPDTRDMLPLRYPNCDCAEEGGAPLRFQLRLQRTVRLISVCLVLLLGLALTTVVLLLFGSPALLRQSQQPATLNALPAPEAVSEKQWGHNPPHQSVLLTYKENPEWQYEVGTAHITEGMTYDRGNLRVPSNGLYRVYLQITYELTEPDKLRDLCDDAGNMSLEIDVRRRSKSYTNFSSLLESKDVMSCSHDWTKSMFTSGTFMLEAQSELQVKILHPQLVRKHDALSFFGVDLITAL